MPILRRIARPALAAVAAVAPASFAIACSGSLHIDVQQSGVYALDHAAIVAQQPGLGDCRSDDLVLTRRGQEVPLRIVGDAHGRFGDGARVEWIGEALHGPASWFDPYSEVDVYLLSAAPGAHARLQTPAADGAASRPAALVRRIHFEQDNELIRLTQDLMQPGSEPDFWQWAKLTHADPQPFAFAFDLPDLRAGAPASVTATFDFRGISFVPVRDGSVKAIDHVVDVQINGRPVAHWQWDGREEIRREVSVPVALLKAAGNVVTLQVPTRFAQKDSADPVIDATMFNWVEMSYPIAGNIEAGNAAFEVAAQDGARTSVELQHAPDHPIALYTSAGQYFPPGSGSRERFAGVAACATLYAVAASELRKPTALRAVANRDWRAADGGYDYLIVSHRSLIAAIEPLAQFHRQQGRKVAVVDVDELYDAFNDGIAHPSAIRDFIAWGRAHWARKPRYVLLVGTASFDIRSAGRPVSMQPATFDARTGVAFSKRPENAAQQGTPLPAERNLIPTWQYPTSEGQSASDNYFVALDGKDFHPSLAIGRLPVVTAEEVAAIVHKTLDYAASPDLGMWRSHVMFIANEDTHFQSASDQIAADIGRQGFSADKIYGKKTERDNLANQAAINDGLNQGDLLVHFLGHGGRFIWRTGPPDVNKNHDLFTLDDVSNLRNGKRLPMVLSMTCFSAPFDNPGEDSIGERFLREPDKGAVAVFAASWSNSPSPEFSRRLVGELVKPGTTIGDAIVAAKATLADRTLVEMYNLLGDPALVLERPRERVQVVRSGGRWAPAVAVRVPESEFGGDVTVTWTDASGNAVAAQTYEARGNQFVLPIPSASIAGVYIYAANYRSGRDALGSLDLRPPPPPRVNAIPRLPAAPATAKSLAPAAPAPSAPAAPVNSVPREDDEIVRRGFSETAPPQRASGKPEPSSDSTVAVDPRPGERKPQKQRRQ